MHYEAYYLLLVAGWQVSVEVRMVSTHGGENLVIAAGSRYAVQVMPALSVQDIVITPPKTFFNFETSFWRGPKKRRAAKLSVASPFAGTQARIEQRALDGAEEADSVPAASPASLSELP